jgi:hypothetical protein
MKTVCLLIFGVVASATALVTAYHIDPKTAAMSGKASGNPEYGGVSQILICCWNELDSASGSYCELFAGETLTGQNYLADVYEVGGPRVAYNLGVHARTPQSWVRMPLTMVAGKSFTKGKLYEFRFTRSGNDSIQFYYQVNDPYPYQYCQIWVGGQPYQTLADLAMRCYGRMNAVDGDLFGAEGSNAWWNWDTWPSRAHEAGVGWATRTFSWAQVETLPDSCRWTERDSETRCLCESVPRVVGIIMQSPPWASSRPPHDDSEDYMSTFAAPRNLWEPVDSDSNYFARFLRKLMYHADIYNKRTSDRIHTWQIWDEPNEGCTLFVRQDSYPGYTGFWRRPDTFYTNDGGIADMSALYMKLASVAAQVIRACTLYGADHRNDTILIGALGRVDFESIPDLRLYKGRDWLEGCYEAAETANYGIFWNGVSVHPYHYGQFSPDSLEEQSRILRDIMKQHGDYGELWSTEFGWPRLFENPTESQQRAARIVAETFTATEGSKALAQGGLDHMCWWAFSELNPSFGNEPLVDSAMKRYPAFYAFKQMTNILSGKRLNGRVMTGDSVTDEQVRMYEFEDTTALKKRTWVGWGMPPTDPGSIAALVPARSDTLRYDSLAYNGSPPFGSNYAEASGWLQGQLSARPVFITETSDESRPELVVDSFWVDPGRPRTESLLTFHARVKNRDAARSTPQGCPTWVWFSWNDSIIDSTYRTDTLGPGDTETISLRMGLPGALHGDGLLAAKVNPGMRYVEKEGTDDNQAYLRLKMQFTLSGGVDVVVPPLHKTPSALLPIGLTSVSWEKDSTGQTQADSARILFAWYGQKDTVVHATDTTAWFPFCPDTTLLFPRGCGVYRVQAQFRDSGENDSPFYPDSIDIIVVFDSVPPTGSIVIDGGARLAPSSTCTLRLAAQDSCSGVAAMRFINTPKVDLVVGGSFTATAGSWECENSEVDTLLHMAKLTVAPVHATVSQFIPAELISAHSGDSCVLEASILAHVHDSDAVGSLSFWYVSTRPDTCPVPETLYQLADSAAFSGSLLSLTGRSCLSKRFLLTQPDQNPEWVWRGGLVKVDAGSDIGNGSVYADNIAISLFPPDSGYFWFAPYDTQAVWDIGTGAGPHMVQMYLRDSAGVENSTPIADTVILDPTPPVVHISLPSPGQLVSHTVQIAGWGYDPIEVVGDSWFAARRLFFKDVDSTNWLPVSPDSISHTPAYPDSQQILGPAVHLGYWCTDSIPDGTYYVRLTATDSAGHLSSCSTWVIVSNSGGGGNFCGGPGGGGSGMGEGSLFVGSGSGYVLHLSDDLDSLDCFQVTDSGSQAYVTSILEVGDDSLLVLDAHNKRVHKLHRNGQHRRRLVSGLSQPMGLIKDDNGNLWLVDRGWHRIGKFRSNGTLVFTRGGLGTDSLHFHSPEGIAVKGDLVYVADGGNNRVVVWDTSGNFRTTITGDFENPTAVMVTDSGTIYLTDGNDGKLKGITPLGGNIVAIGTTDSSKLKGLVPSENRHSLFSLASVPNRVYKLRIQSDESMPGGQQSAGKVNLPKTLSLAQPFPNPARTRLNIAYALPHQTRVVLKMYDVAGKLVTTLANGDQRPGYHSMTWNRQDIKGRTCACGVYFCTLTAENQRFSRKVVLTD